MGPFGSQADTLPSGQNILNNCIKNDLFHYWKCRVGMINDAVILPTHLLQWEKLSCRQVKPLIPNHFAGKEPR